jgi:hypothetical protein
MDRMVPLLGLEQLTLTIDMHALHVAPADEKGCGSMQRRRVWQHSISPAKSISDLSLSKQWQTDLTSSRLNSYLLQEAVSLAHARGIPTQCLRCPVVTSLGQHGHAIFAFSRPSAAAASRVTRDSRDSDARSGQCRRRA